MKSDQQGEHVGSSEPPFEAALIGSFALRRGPHADFTPKARRSRALVAYLILSPSGAITRDRLAALLWSERADEQARASLRQVLFELRELACDRGLLAVSRSEVSLTAAGVTTDLDAFERAARAGDAVTVAGLYGEQGAPLLEDLDGISPLFDDWLSSQRERWREDRRDLALKLCRRTLDEGGWDTAYRLARALVLADPLDEAATNIAMEAAYAGGDPQTVRRLFSTLEVALRQELGVAPSAATRQIYASLTDGSASPAAPVRAIAADDERSTGPNEAMVPSAPILAPVRSGRWWPIALSACAIIGLGAAAMLSNRPAESSDADPVVLVEPIAASHEDRAAHMLGAGLSTTLARDLVGTGTPVQIVDGLTESAARPALALRGNAVANTGDIRANVELTAGPRRAVIWSDRFDGRTADVDRMIERISLQVARELHCAYGDGRTRIWKNDPETARLALAACDAVGRDFLESARYSAQAVARAPNYARGWSEYAAATVFSTSAPPSSAASAVTDAQARVYARRAIALDPRQGLAYAAIAWSLPGLDHWFERYAIAAKGLKADPANAEINAVRGQDLANIGRLRDAFTFMQRSFAIDHFLPGKVQELADLEANMGDLNDADALLKRGEMLWPRHPWFDDLEYELAFHWGRPSDALLLLNEQRTPRSSDEIDRLFIAWRAAPSPSTKKAAVRAITAEAARTGPSVEGVQLLAALGQLDGAYRLAERLPASTDAGSTWYRDYLAPFRADPRFMPFAARLGLAEIWRRSGLWPDFCTDFRLRYNCRTAADQALSSARAVKPSFS